MTRLKAMVAVTADRLGVEQPSDVKAMKQTFAPVAVLDAIEGEPHAGLA